MVEVEEKTGIVAGDGEVGCSRPDEKTPLSEGNNEEDDVPPGFGTNSGARVNPEKEKAVYDIIAHMKKIPVLLSMFHALNFLHGDRFNGDSLCLWKG
jgi:hypothetical protein